MKDERKFMPEKSLARSADPEMTAFLEAALGACLFLVLMDNCIMSSRESVIESEK